MLWVRNGYVELTIILNHKHIQYMFTLPFLHTLPIIITNKETAFSDLVIFWLITMSYWFIHQIIRKEERFVVGSVWCHFKHYNFQHEAKSPDELNIWHLRPQVGSPFCVAYMCTCTPSVITQRGSVSAQGSSTCNSYLAEGKVYGKGPGWDCGEDGPGADCRWWGKAVVLLGMQGADGKSSGGALTARPMSKAAGREGLGSSATERDKPAVVRAWRS